jgi:gluconate:H+ symporter, GntP family
MSRDGLAMMGGTLTAGILVGYVFVVPGLGTVAIAGLLGVPLSTMLIYGFLVGPPTAVLTTFIYGQLLKYGLRNKAKDEAHFEERQEGNPSVDDEEREGSSAVTE